MDLLVGGIIDPVEQRPPPNGLFETREPRVAAAIRVMEQHIDDTLNYKAVAKRIQAFVAESSFQLVETLAEKIAALSGIPDAKVFFTNSGAESNECALKLARKWGRLHRGGASEIVTTHGAFHGRTHLTLAMSTSRALDRKGYGPFPPGVFIAPFPDPHASDQEREVSSALRGLDRVISTQVAATQVAALVIEPVIGERGYIPTPRGFLEGLEERWQSMREKASRYRRQRY